MAKPRIFISSTFYDLHHIRTDLERFIRDLGFEPVMNERGTIPYGKSEALEEYCYREIRNCDILIHLVGGRYGSQSKEEPYSISQMELKVARELQKQVYICIERAVHVEYGTFLKNERNENFQPQYVDNLKTYKFLKEVLNLPANNVIVDFGSVAEMLSFLKEQWAGLFQRFLQEESRREDYKISANLRSTAETLAKLLEKSTEERDEEVKAILIYNHPVFIQIKQATGIPIRVFFSSVKEMMDLFLAFGYSGELFPEGGFYNFWRFDEGKDIYIDQYIFDEEDKLKAVDQGQWERVFVKEDILRKESPSDDDIPF